MLRASERFASGSALTLPFPSHLRSVNRALGKVRKSADRLLDALSQPTDLFGEVEGYDINVLWEALATATAGCAQALEETPQQPQLRESGRLRQSGPELALR
jgi:hypothetical protein